MAATQVHASENSRGISTESPSGSDSNCPPSDLHPIYGVGSWIWDSETRNKQTCRLWTSFHIPKGSPVADARLRMTADNGYRVFLDGQEIGRGSDYRTLSDYDLRGVVTPGHHALAVEAFNDNLGAGMVLGLRAILEDGQVIEVASDQKWFIAPESDPDWLKRTTAGKSWPHAKLVSEFMTGPWKRKPDHLVQVPAPQPRPPVEFWQKGGFQIALVSVSGVVVLVCLRLMMQLAAQLKAQRLLQRERARIARDIHDDLGAGLTQLVLLGEVARSEMPGKEESRGQITQLCENARSLMITLDEIVWAVNSRRDTLKDFATYMCKYAQAFLQSTSIRCRLDVEPDLPAINFDLPVRRNLFQAVKEAINNAARHSGATELFLRIHRNGSTVIVVVEDNGKGFDPVAADPERNGLTNMAQRMEEVGGIHRIVSRPGAGCRVEFRINLTAAQQWRFWWSKWRFGRPATRDKASGSAPVALAPAPHSAGNQP